MAALSRKRNLRIGRKTKSGIYKIESVKDTKQLIIHHNWVSLENTAFASSYTINADGDLNDFNNLELADKVQALFPDSISFEIHFYKKEKWCSILCMK